MILADPTRFRRLVAGVCLIVAPATLLVGALVHPQTERDGAEHLAVVAENPDRNYAAHAILLVGLALFLPALLGLMHLVRRRATTFGHLGTGLALIGVLGSTAIVATDGIAITQMAQPGADTAEMAALLDRIKDSAGLRAIGAVGALSFAVGMMLLAYGLWHARRARPVVAILVGAAAIAVFVGQATDESLILALGFAIYLVSLGPLGWRVLNESDEEWARERHASTPPPAPAALS